MRAARQRLFSGAVSFNRELNGWNVGQVTNAYNLFADAASFDQDLNAWDTAKFNGLGVRRRCTCRRAEGGREDCVVSLAAHTRPPARAVARDRVPS